MIGFSDFFFSVKYHKFSTEFISGNCGGVFNWAEQHLKELFPISVSSLFRTIVLL